MVTSPGEENDLLVWYWNRDRCFFQLGAFLHRYGCFSSARARTSEAIRLHVG